MNELTLDILRGRSLDVQHAAALVAGVADEFAARRARGEVIAVPADEAIVVDRTGAVTFTRVETNREPADGAAALAALLQRLLNLDGQDAHRQPVPGSLMVLVARALGKIDLPPPGLRNFREALERITGSDARALRAEVANAILHPVRRPEGTDTERVVTVSSAPDDLTRTVLAFAAGVVVAFLGALAFRGPLPWVTQRFNPVTPPVPQAMSRVQPAPPAGVVGIPSTRSASRSTVHLVLGDVAGGEPFSPSFAPDGRTLYFHTGRSNGRLMRADLGPDGRVSAVSTVLRDGASNFHVVPSPDGSRIAFDSDRDGERAVFVARADSSGVQRVSGAGFAAVPSWSPDGAQLAFVKADERDARVWNVWIADLQSGRLRQVSDHRVGQAWGASWFPDGRRIAYSREEELVILDLASGRRTRVRSPRAGHVVRTPAVSPDGTRVVFQVYGDGVWMLDLVRGQISRILTDRTAEEFRWSPDGRRIAYHARNGRHWGVWTLGASS